MNFSHQQSTAIKAVDYWFKNNTKTQQIFRLFGFAGTGKTTLAKHLAATINGRVIFCAYTGKAALMMRKNGCTDASTIHSLVYIAKRDEEGNFHFFINHCSEIHNCDLIIVDECSMVNDELARDMLSFRKPILVLGDPAQLPPPKGEGFFTNAQPDILLTEIHRQSADNPIIRLANAVRTGKTLNNGKYNSSIISNTLTEDDLVNYDQIIVGKNSTKDSLNRRLRKILGYGDEFPEYGEKIISLENNRLEGFFNGGIYEVDSCIPSPKQPDFLEMRVVSSELDLNRPSAQNVKVAKSCFSDLHVEPEWKKLKGSHKFDYAYSMTCHRAQGSQWESSLIIDESYCFREFSKNWLYTAITRNQERFKLCRRN